MKFAICNETFEGWDHARVCEEAARLGYQGLELAPFTLGKRVTDVSAEKRASLKAEADKHGLEIIGLHWLLAKTEGLQLTAPHPKVRQETADYIVELARCCRDVGGKLMVFGSPLQRRVPPGCTHAQATDFAVETLEKALPRVAECGVTICLEPLSPPEADFINTCREGMAIIDRIKHPNLVLHLDVKAMSTDEAPTPELIRTYGKHAGHFHANDANMRGPGFGNTDFVPIFQALKDSGYGGWVSVEVFDYSPDPVTIARDSIKYMKDCLAKTNGQ